MNKIRDKENFNKKIKEYLWYAQGQKDRRIIALTGKSPHLIEARLNDGKIELIAIEILPEVNRDKTPSHSWTTKQKKDQYQMFDEVLIIQY